MVNMNVAYRGPDGLSKTLLAELQARYGARAQNKGFVTGYMDAARRGELGGHFADNLGITHAIDIGVDIELDGSGLLPKDALWVAEYLRKLGAAGRHPFSRQGYLIHDMSTTVNPAPRIAGAFNQWTWAYYGGSSPHSDHIHLTTAGDNQWGEPSRLAPAVYNSTATWGLRPGTVVKPPPPPAPSGAMRPVPEMYGVTQTYRQDSTQFNLGAFHGAIDYGCPEGTPIVAPEDGVVVFDGWAWDLPGGPNDYHLRWYLIKPAYGDTRTGGGILTIFRNAAGSHWGIAHAGESFYNKGDRIRKGDHIQWSGRTGSVTGAHSHVNLWPSNPNWQNGGFGAIDPQPWIKEKWRPNQVVRWVGAPTTGVGGTTAPPPVVIAPKPKTVLEEIMALDRGSAEYRAVISDIADAVLTKRVNLTGSDPDGKPYTGTTSLGQEAAWGTFRGFRDRRIEQNGDKALEVLQALTTVLLAHVEEGQGSGNPDNDGNLDPNGPRPIPSNPEGV